MATQMQLRGGTTAENLLFTGAQREVTVDTDRNALIVHDGVTAGGYPTASEAEVVNGTFYFNDNVGGGSAANAYILTPMATTNVPNSYTDGLQLGFTTNNPNTGPATATFSGIGVKSLKYRGGADPAAGDISGRVYVIFDEASDWFEIQRKASGPSPQIRPLTGSVSGNALTVTALPQVVEFRSAALNNGAVNARSFGGSLSITAPAGATFGTSSGVLSRIAVLYIDNAGVVELALTNAANNVLGFDETGLTATTAISGSSTSANVVYSATSLGGVPYRVAGFIESTQTVAGTWSTTPSKVQGQGGQTLIGFVTVKNGSGLIQSSTSGVSIDFTGIPNWAKRITVSLSAVSTSGSSNYRIQLGAGSIEATGYTGAYFQSLSAAPSSASFTLGFEMIAAASEDRSGSITLTTIGGNTWVASGSFGASSGRGISLGGTKTLSGTLDRVRITTANGTDAFDAGAINIFYEG